MNQQQPTQNLEQIETNHRLVSVSVCLSDLDFKYPPHSQPTLDGVNSVIVLVLCSGTLVVTVACCCVLCYVLAQTAQVYKWISFPK